MYIDITAANAPNFLRNYGVARDIADTQLAHDISRKLIEWEADPSGTIGELVEFAQALAMGEDWLAEKGVVADTSTEGAPRTPRPGTALNFTATEYVNAGSMPAFGSQMSGGIWFRGSPTHSADAGLFSAYSVTPDPDRSLRFYVNTSGQLLGYFSDDGSTATQIAGALSTPTMPLGLNDGQWHHFWFTFDAGAWKFYIDGMLKGTQVTSQTTIRVPTTPLLIGSDFQGNRKWFGQLFDFRLYDTVSTADHVWALWLQGKQPWKVATGQPEYPVRHYPLSSGSRHAAFAAQGLGADQYATTVPFTDENWDISNPSGGGFVDGEVQLSGSYVSLRPAAPENQVLRGGTSYLVTLVIKDWNGGHIQFRPYVGGTTTNIVTARTFAGAVAGPITIQQIVEMPKANGLGYINFQSNSGGTTREMTVVNFKAQEYHSINDLTANIINSSDDTVYIGSDVPFSPQNLTGSTTHCRYNFDSSDHVQWDLAGFDVPEQFSWRFIFTVESFANSSGGTHVHTLVSSGYISPYWIGPYNPSNFRVIYKDSSNAQQVVSAYGDMTWLEGVEYDLTVDFDSIAGTITLTEANYGQSHVHTMPNGLYGVRGGVTMFGGYGSGAAAGANFDGSIDFIQYKKAGTTVLELDYRQDGLVSASDAKVATVGFPTFNGLDTFPELISTPSKAIDRTKDSYGQGSVQHAGLCPKQGQLVNSGCATLDGNDYITSSVAPTSYQQVTVASWVRLSTNTPWPFVFSTTSTNAGFELALANSNRYVVWRVKNGAAWYDATTLYRVPVGEWIHLAATYDGQALRVYMNGQLAAETIQPNIDFGTGAGNILMGQRGGYYWYGQLMNARVYDRGLSASEVAAVYEGNGTNTDLQIHWPMSETVGTTVHDASGNGNNGTVSGGSIDDFWETKQTLFHHNVSKGCDVVADFPNNGGTGKNPTCPQPVGANSCYSFWFNSRNNSATSNLFRNSGIACTILPNNLRFTYAAILDYHFNTTGTLAVNEWHHCTISVDDNDATLYLNGVFSETVSGSQNPNQGGTIFIGGYGTLGGLFKMADFIVLDRPVTGAAEAASIYQGNVPSDALAAYKLAGSLEDSTGNTSPVLTGDMQFVELPATDTKTSLFRSSLSHPSGAGLNSTATKIDPTPEPDASYLHSGIGHLACTGATTSITRPYISALPDYVPNMNYDTGWTVNVWARLEAYNGGILGGHGNNYFKVNATNTIYVRGNHSPNNIKFDETAAAMNGLRQWNHFVLRYDPNQPIAARYNLFVNGQKKAAQTVLTSVQAGNSWAIDRIARYGQTGPLLNGDVKDVRMYSELFSDAECEAMYASKFPSSDNLEAHWPFGSHTGDVSGNGRHLIPQDSTAIPPRIDPANFGGETYLGEALFDYGDYATLNWVWNVNNQFNEGFDISFTMSTNGTTAWGQGVLWGGNDQPVFYIRTDGSLRVYLDQFTAATVATGLDDGVRRRIRVVFGQDNGGTSTLQAYVDGVAQTPATVASPMPAMNTSFATIGMHSGGGNSFAGTLSDFSISLNGGTAYEFPLARDANSTDGTYVGTYANANTKPLFRSRDSSNIGIGSVREYPSTAVSSDKLISQIKTKGY